MGKSFKNITLSAVGQFGENTSKIPGWVRANGGTYSKALDETVTHLVTSEEAFKENGDLVKNAKGMENVKIVSYHWLADSLQSKGRRPKGEREYLWANILKKREKKQEKGKPTKDHGRRSQGELKSGKAGKPARKHKKVPPCSVKRMVSRGYQPYLSDSGVAYYASMVRPLVATTSSREKYIIQIWQTKESPYTYAVVVRQSRVGESQEKFLAAPGTSLEDAMATFKNFFKLKTGVEWEDRFDDLPLKESSTPGSLSRRSYTFERPRGLLAELMISREKANTTQDGLVSEMEGETANW